MRLHRQIWVDTRWIPGSGTDETGAIDERSSWYLMLATWWRTPDHLKPCQQSVAVYTQLLQAPPLTDVVDNALDSCTIHKGNGGYMQWQHRGRSGWNSGGTPLRYAEGCPLFSRLGGLGERRELPQPGPGGAPAKNGFWRFLKATERSFLYLYDKICGGGTICIIVPLLQILGGTCPPCLPRDLRPWVTGVAGGCKGGRCAGPRAAYQANLLSLWA